MKTKNCTIEIPIDQEIYSKLEKRCLQINKSLGLPEMSPESCIADAIVLYHQEPLNNFLRAYVSKRFSNDLSTSNVELTAHNCTIEIPIDQETYKVLEKRCQQIDLPGLSPESCIADAIELYHQKPLNEFLCKYVAERFSNYPKVFNVEPPVLNAKTAS